MMAVEIKWILFRTPKIQKILMTLSRPMQNLNEKSLKICTIIWNSTPKKSKQMKYHKKNGVTVTNSQLKWEKLNYKMIFLTKKWNSKKKNINKKPESTLKIKIKVVTDNNKTKTNNNEINIRRDSQWTKLVNYYKKETIKLSRPKMNKFIRRKESTLNLYIRRRNLKWMKQGSWFRLKKGVSK